MLMRLAIIVLWTWAGFEIVYVQDTRTSRRTDRAWFETTSPPSVIMCSWRRRRRILQSCVAKPGLQDSKKIECDTPRSPATRQAPATEIRPSPHRAYLSHSHCLSLHRHAKTWNAQTFEQAI